VSDYLAAASIYRRAGWTGPLPLPTGKKWPPPEGYTGWHGHDPSGADSQAWFDDDPIFRGTTQLGLRMPEGVIGIDVDHYGVKRGAATLEEAIRRWGPLPEAPMSSARGDGPSGIQFFRVAKGVHLRTVLRFAAVGVEGQPGYRPALGHVEIIQRHHRYAVAYPSVHPDTGDPYLWYRTPGPDVPPSAPGLPRLPDRWAEELRGADEPGVAEATPEQVAAFGREHDRKEGGAALAGVLATFRKAVDGGVARHDAMVNAACMAAREARDGCYTAAETRATLRLAFTEALCESRNGQRLCTAGEARAEFEAVWAWAVSQALAEDEASREVRKARRAAAAPRGVTEKARYTAIVPDDRPQQAPAFTPPTWPAATTPEPVAAPTPTVVPAPVSTPQTGSVFVLDDDAPVTVEPRVAPLMTLPDLSTWTPPTLGAAFYASADGSTNGASGASGQPDDDLRSGSSWRPIDLAADWDIESEPEQPTMLRRSDGVFLLYPGRTHSIYGESESGKSWVALIAAAEALAAEQDVLYIDHESDPDPIKSRLKLLGVTAVMAKRLTYVRPDGPRDSAWLDLLDQTYHLAVIDGVTVAISTDGGNSDSQDETARWLEQVPRMLEVRTGAAVLTAVSGAAYTARVHTPFGRGQRGELVLRLTKDRPGGIRPACGPPGDAGTQEAARVVLDSRQPGRIIVEINMWSADGDEATDLPFGAPLESPTDWTHNPEPLPQRVQDYTGPGRAAVPSLAKYMRHAANNDAGITRNDARAALDIALVDEKGKPLYDRATVNRAWTALALPLQPKRPAKNGQGAQDEGLGALELLVPTNPTGRARWNPAVAPDAPDAPEGN
jgi:hypothetical protein